MMNINSFNNTPLLPQEAADPLAKARQGANPNLPSRPVTSVEPVQKSAQEAGHKQSSAEQGKNGKAYAGDNRNRSGNVNPSTNSEVGRKAEAGENASLLSRDEAIVKSRPGADGPQLELLKRQLAAKRSQARQVYLNTLETKVIDNIGSGSNQFGEADNIAEVTETLNDYAQIIRRDLTFSQQEGNINVAIHDRSTGELIRNISPEEAIELSADLDQFKAGHLFEIRA